MTGSLDGKAQVLDLKTFGITNVFDVKSPVTFIQPDLDWKGFYCLTWNPNETYSLELEPRKKKTPHEKRQEFVQFILDNTSFNKKTAKRNIKKFANDKYLEFNKIEEVDMEEIQQLFKQVDMAQEAKGKLETLDSMLDDSLSLLVDKIEKIAELKKLSKELLKDYQ